MDMLNVIKNNEIQNKMKKFALDNRISQDEVICSIVYEFASKLPYSIDYMDEDFVPGIFLNVGPVNPEKGIFKYSSSLYDKMVNWGDTLKSGILLQLCFIFQRMLVGEFPNNYRLSDDDYHNLGIDQMTSDEEYNRYLFEFLQMLPEYCAKVNSVSGDDRRKVLDEIYAVILDRVGQKVGGFRRESITGDVISVQEYKATIRLFPHRDLDMLYYFNNIRFGFGIRNLVDEINKEFVFKTCLDESNNECVKKRVLGLNE